MLKMHKKDLLSGPADLSDLVAGGTPAIPARACVAGLPPGLSPCSMPRAETDKAKEGLTVNDPLGRSDANTSGEYQHD